MASIARVDTANTVDPRHRVLKVAAVSLGGFIVTFGLVFLLSRPSWDRSDCEGEECIGALAASIFLATLGGLAVSVSAGVVAWLLLRRNGEPPSA